MTTKPIFDTGTESPANNTFTFKAQWFGNDKEVTIHINKGEFIHTMSLHFIGDQFAEYDITTEQARLVYEHGYFDIIDGEITAIQHTNA